MRPHRPSPAELRVLSAAMPIDQLAAMLGATPATVRTWIAEIEVHDAATKKPQPVEAGAWRARLDEALDRAMNTLIGALMDDTLVDPKDKIAQAKLALSAIPALLEAKAAAPSSAAPAIDRDGLLAKARRVSQGADRARLRLVGT